MADVKFEVVPFDLPDSGTSLDISAPSGFGTPKAVFIHYNNSTSEDTKTANIRTGYGFTDGVNQVSTGVAVNDAVTTMTLSRATSSLFSMINLSTAGAITVSLDFNKWLEQGVDGVDGVRFDYDPTGYSVPRKASCVFIGGADVANAHVGSFPIDGPAVVTGLGFEPSMLLGISSQTLANASGATAILDFSMALNDVGLTQRTTEVRTGGGTLAVNNAVINTTKFFQAVNDSGDVRRVEITGFNADGFTFDFGGATYSSIIGYLALEFTGDPDVALVDTQCDIGVTPYALTGLNFQPTFGLAHFVHVAANYNSNRSTNVWGSSLVGFSDNATYSLASSSRDATSSGSVAKCYATSNFYLIDDRGNTEVEGGPVSFTLDGWSVPLTRTAAGSNVLGFALAIGPGAAAGVSFDGPDIVPQTGTQDTLFTFDENGEGTVASRFTGATSYALAPTSDALPAGLTVNPTTGNIEGTPTEAVTRNIIIEGSD